LCWQAVFFTAVDYILIRRIYRPFYPVFGLTSKIMRRLLRARALGLPEGDVSTLEE
jgi:hypothetical protein